jgi:hypothetical protein
MQRSRFRRKLYGFGLTCCVTLTALGCGGLTDQQLTQILSSVITSGLTAVVTGAVGSATGNNTGQTP